MGDTGEHGANDGDRDGDGRLPADGHRAPATRVVHATGAPDATTGAVVPPLHMSTTFERAADGTYPHGNLYLRSDSPTRERFEAAVNDLEGGAGAVAFASGTAAGAAVLQGLAPGARVVAPTDGYHGTRAALAEMSRWGIEVVYADFTDVRAVEAACAPGAALVWIETPSNPSLRITDIAAVTAVAHRHGALAVVDNTWPTPLLTRPLALGADLVVHSTTKYLGGHGDLLGGVVVAADRARAERLADLRTVLGAVAAPVDCWLALRGLRTLAVRFRQACDNAEQLASFLAEHPAVDRVHYPGLPGHPGHATARAQMDRFGAMLSFEVRGGRDAAFAVAAGVRLITRATSLGSVETTIEHRASIEGEDSPTPQSLLRLSVGIEDPGDLVEDLRLGLSQAGATDGR